MTTTANIKVYQNVPTLLKVRARGYWDQKVGHVFTTENESYSVTMDVYDGLSYSTSLSSDNTPMFDFTNTILPYAWEYNKKLSTSRYCFKPAGQNYDLSTDKYVNYVKVGSPTVNIDTGIVSNMSSSNYLKLVEAFNPSSNPWEMVFKIKTPATFPSGYNQFIFNASLDTGDSGRFGVQLAVFGEGRLLLQLSDTGSSWIGGGYASPENTLTTNTDYWVKVTYDGTDYSLQYSEDGTTYTTLDTRSGSQLCSPLILSYIGYGIGSSAGGFAGSIDLSQSYIKVNGQTWWTAEGAYNNFDVIGGVSINQSNGQATSFSSTNYLQLIEPFNPKNKTWEVRMKFTTSNDVVDNQKFFNSCKGTGNANRYGIGANINTSSHFAYFLSADGSSWLFDTFGTYTVLANTTYWVKLGWDGSYYYLEYSTDGTNFTRDIEYQSSTPVYGSLIYSYIGIYSTTSMTHPFLGTIDLSQCSIIIDGQTWWTPKTLEALAGITVDYTDDGSAVTMNCFAVGDTNVILTEANTYTGGTYLGTVSVPAHSV